MIRILVLAAAIGIMGCRDLAKVDTTPPVRPQGVTALALDNSVQLQWLANSEPDLAGYNVWSSDQYDGRYQLIGTTSKTTFTDYRVTNGSTYYYAITAYDFDKNESGMSKEVVVATPRPEGFGVRLSDYHTSPLDAGYDFSTYSVGKYNDKYSDVFFESVNGRNYLDVWNDSDIQDMGYTSSFDEITKAPVSGWAPSKSAEAIVGHTYVVWTWDDHYAKVRLTDVSSTRIIFDWSYQTVKGNIALKRDVSQAGVRKPLSRP